MRTSKEARQDYLNSVFGGESKSMREIREYTEANDRIIMQVSSHEAQILRFFVTSFACKKIVEIGTLNGYSAMAMAEAMPEEGKIWCLEKDASRAAKCQEFFHQSAQAKKLQILLGDAEENLQQLSSQAPFDLVFIDANKGAYLDYLIWAEEHLKPGGLVIGDNTFLFGNVYGDTDREQWGEKQITQMQEFNRRIANPEKYSFMMIPTSEGMTVGRKLSS